MNGLMYYYSPGLVDQLYRSLEGPLRERTVGRERISSASVEGKFSLDGLVKWLSGFKAEAEANFTRQGKTVDTAVVKETSDDRALQLLTKWRKGDGISSLAQLSTSNSLPHLCSFTGMAILTHGLSPYDKVPSIVVEICTEQVRLVGYTSPENWRSPSLRNSMLWSSHKGGPGSPVSGFVVPLAFDAESSQPKLNAQYILIGHPTLLSP